MICFLDLDGTLLGRGGSLVHDLEGRPSADATRALTRLHEAGVPVVLVSGRTSAGLHEPGRMVGASAVIPELGALDTDLATSGGGTPHDAIAASGLPARLGDRAGGRLVADRSGPARVGTHLFRGALDEDLAAWVVAASAGRLRLIDNGSAEGDDVRAVHLAPAGAGKGPAASRAARRLGVDPGSCLAIGDGPDDLAMQDHIGWTALVANGAAGHPELASRGRWITGSPGAAGVLEAVEAWLECGRYRPAEARDEETA